MSFLPEFRLETFFSKWEFRARYHLTGSDAETMTVSRLLELADDEDRRAWDELRLGYTETFGDPGLREAIAGTYDGIRAEDVICFSGAQEAIYLAMQVLLGPQDHAIVVTPNYQAAETVPLAICEVTGIALDAGRNWALDLNELIAAIRPATRVISINFPNNPTGKLIDQPEFGRLVELCDERGIFLFSDEVYRGLELDASRTLPQAADLSERALSLNVTSKALGLPGLRIGWIACRDPGVIARLERAKHYTTICNAAPSEILARIAIKASRAIMERNRGIITTNLPMFDAFFAEFAELFEWAPPDGGCVCFPRYLGPGDVDSFCAKLVEETGVLLSPASIYRSELTATPTDRFRIGVGRADPQPGLEAFASWIRKT